MSSIATIDEIIDKLRLAIARSGIPTLCITKLMFKEYDSNNSKQIQSDEFLTALLRSKIFLSKYETSSILRQYKVNDLCLDYGKFLEDAQVPLDGKRLYIVTKLFNSLKNNNNQNVNVISKQELISNFDAKQHPQVVAGQFAAGQVQDMVIQAFQKAEDENGNIDWETYLDYFRGISTAYPYNEQRFVTFVNNCWKCIHNKNTHKKSNSNGLQEQKKKQKENVDVNLYNDTDNTNNNDIEDKSRTISNEIEKEEKEKANEQLNEYFEQVESMLADKVRQKMPDGSNEQMTLKKSFAHFDLNNSGTVSYDEYLKVLEKYGILMPEKDAKQMFSQWDKNNDGELQYGEFIQALFNKHPF